MSKRKTVWLLLGLLGFLSLAAERGPFTVGELALSLQDTTRGRRVEALLLYPVGQSPAPLVVFSPGFLFSGPAYRSWGEFFASHGLATALISYAYSLFNPDHRAWAMDLLFLLDALPGEAARRGVDLDPTRVALVGHSLGGKLSFLVAAERPVQAVVGLDPVDGGAPGVTDLVRFPSAIAVMGSVRAPILILGTEYGERVRFGMPCAPPEANFRRFFEAAPGPALEIVQRGAGHVDYLDDPNCGFLCSVCWPGEDPWATRAAAQIYVLFFLQGHLWEQEEGLGALRARLAQEAQVQRVSVQEKPGPTP